MRGRVSELSNDRPAVLAMRVLLVEDDEGDAFRVRELMLDAHAEVELVRVRSLAEAEAARPGEFDCVLLDIDLPDANGLEALHAVLELAPGIAVLVLTGLADEHRATMAVAAGAQDYLVKGSLDGQLLNRAIRYAVERKRLDESVRRLYASEARAAENARLERGLLPQPLVGAPWLQVVPRYRPGRHQSLLGGDFYDVVERDDSIFALVGDVAGHGPDEAALGVLLRVAWRTLVLSGADPDTILTTIDSVLVTERAGDEVFATVAMVRLSPAEGTLRIWRAGHPVPVIIEAGGVLPVAEGEPTLALGIVPGSTWPRADYQVGAEAAVLLFTDGLIEGFDGETDGQRLGEARLYRVIGDLLDKQLDPDELCDALLAEVRARNGGELTDDVAILMLAWSSLP